MNNQKTLRTGVVCLIVAVLTLVCLVGTMAKYVTTGSFNDEARVAKWGLNITAEENVNLFNSQYENADQSITVKSFNGDHVIAPGTDGSKSIYIDYDGYAPETAYKLDFNLAITDSADPSYSTIAKLDQNPNFKWFVYVNGFEFPAFDTHAEVEQVVNDLSKNYVEPNQRPIWMNDRNVIGVGWKWLFYTEDAADKLDTELGDMAANGLLDTINAKLTIAATQIVDVPAEHVTVAFDTKGGSKTPDSQTFNKGDKATKPADPTKDGYKFRGWVDEDDNSWDFDNAVNSSMTLFADWEEVKLRGQVVDDATKTPVADASVQFGHSGDEVKTDAQGYFEVDMQSAYDDNIYIRPAEGSPFGDFKKMHVKYDTYANKDLGQIGIYPKNEVHMLGQFKTSTEKTAEDIPADRRTEIKDNFVKVFSNDGQTQLADTVNLNRDWKFNVALTAQQAEYNPKVELYFFYSENGTIKPFYDYHFLYDEYNKEVEMSTDYGSLEVHTRSSIYVDQSDGSTKMKHFFTTQQRDDVEGSNYITWEDVVEENEEQLHSERQYLNYQIPPNPNDTLLFSYDDGGVVYVKDFDSREKDDWHTLIKYSDNGSGEIMPEEVTIADYFDVDLGTYIYADPSTKHDGDYRYSDAKPQVSFVIVAGETGQLEGKFTVDEGSTYGDFVDDHPQDLIRGDNDTILSPDKQYILHNEDGEDVKCDDYAEDDATLHWDKIE